MSKKNGWFFSRSILDEIKNMEEETVEKEELILSTEVGKEEQDSEVEQLKEALALARYKNERLRSEKNNLERRIADQVVELREKGQQMALGKAVDTSETEQEHRKEEERLIQEIDRLKKVVEQQEQALDESNRELALFITDTNHMKDLEEEAKLAREKYAIFEAQYQQNQEQWQHDLALSEKQAQIAQQQLESDQKAHSQVADQQQQAFSSIEQQLREEITQLTQLNEQQSVALTSTTSDLEQLNLKYNHQVHELASSLNQEQGGYQSLSEKLRVKEKEWQQEQEGLLVRCQNSEELLAQERHELAEMAQNLKEKETIMGGLEQEMNRINEENQRLSKVRDNQLSDEEIKGLQFEIQQLMIRTEELSKENEEQKQIYKEENHALENKIIELADYIQMTEASLKEVKAENEKNLAIQTEKQALVEEVARLQTELLEKGVLLGQLEQELNVLSQAKQTELTVDDQLIDELQTKIKELKEENQFLQTENGGIQSEISEILLFTRKQANRTLEEAQAEASKVLRAAEVQVANLRSRANEIVFEVRDSKESILSIYQDVENQVQELVDNALHFTNKE